MKRICSNRECGIEFTAKKENHTTCPNCHKAFLEKKRTNEELKRKAFLEKQRIQRAKWELEQREIKERILLEQEKKKKEEEMCDSIWNGTYNVSSGPHTTSKNYMLQVVYHIYECYRDSDSDDEDEVVMKKSFPTRAEVRTMPFINGIFSESDRLGSPGHDGVLGDLNPLTKIISKYYSYRGNIYEDEIAIVNRARIVKKPTVDMNAKIHLD